MGGRRSSLDWLSAGFQSEKMTGESEGTKPGSDVTGFADHDESGLVNLATKPILAVKSTNCVLCWPWVAQASVPVLGMDSTVFHRVGSLGCGSSVWDLPTGMPAG